MKKFIKKAAIICLSVTLILGNGLTSYADEDFNVNMFTDEARVMISIVTGVVETVLQGNTYVADSIAAIKTGPAQPATQPADSGNDDLSEEQKQANRDFWNSAPEGHHENLRLDEEGVKKALEMGITFH